MPLRDFPDVDPSKVYAVQGSTLKQMFEALQQDGNLRVAPPLFVKDGPGGKVICLALPPGATLLRLTSAATGAGTYNARVQVVSTTTQASTTDLNLATWVSDLNTSDDAVFQNLAENKQSGHALKTGADSFVLGWLTQRFASDLSNRPIYQGQPPPPRDYVEFRVALTQTGGSGTAGWTYTAKTMDGTVTLGTGLAPEDPHWGNTTAATGGIGYYDNTGTFFLSRAFEGRTPDTSCS